MGIVFAGCRNRIASLADETSVVLAEGAGGSGFCVFHIHMLLL